MAKRNKFQSIRHFFFSNEQCSSYTLSSDMNIHTDCYISKDTFFINTLIPRQNGHHFADNIFKCIFLKENVWISLKISLMSVPKIQINSIPALVQMMAWHRLGDKPLSEPMMVSLLMHIFVTWPQWVNVQLLNSFIVCRLINYNTHFGHLFIKWDVLKGETGGKINVLAFISYIFKNIHLVKLLWCYHQNHHALLPFSGKNLFLLASGTLLSWCSWLKKMMKIP